MAQQTVSYLKSRFQAGDQPTQQNFYDWLDSFVHQSDAPAYFNTPGFRVEDYGAMPGGTLVDDASMELGSDILTTAVGRFTADNVGDKANVWGAGFHINDSLVTSVDSSGLYADIVEYIAPNQVRLSRDAERDVDSVPAAWGPGTNTGIVAAQAAAAEFEGGDFIFGSGIYIIDSSILLASNYRFIGQGYDRTTLVNVAPRHMFRGQAGGYSNLRWEGLNMVNVRGGWYGGSNVIAIGGATPNYGLRILDCRFQTDNRTMNLSNIQGAWCERCVFAPLTDGSCNFNITDPAVTSRYIWILNNMFEAMGGTRSTARMVDGDVSTILSEDLVSQATINLRASHVFVEHNQFLGPNFCGIFFEGINQEEVYASHNVIHCQDGYTLQPIYGIDVKVTRRIGITHNEIYGNDYQKALSDSAGIRIFPGTSDATKTYADQMGLESNVIEKWDRPIYVGDSNTLTKIGSFDILNNRVRDAGREWLTLQLSQGDASGATVRVKNNLAALSASGSGGSASIQPGTGLKLIIEGNQGKNMTDPLFALGVVGLGSILRQGGNSNESGLVWKASGAGVNLKDYTGTFTVTQRNATLRAKDTLDLSASPATVLVGVMQFTNRHLVKARFTYLEATDATAGITITLKTDDTTTLLTYTTKINKALYFTEEVTFSGITLGLLNPAHYTITATCAGGGGPGIVAVEVDVMPN